MTIFSSLKSTLISTSIAMISTILGSSCIFFVRKNLNIKHYKIFLGFMSGMMISSAIWSLLIPATELYNNKVSNLFLITIGFLLGTLSFKLIDKLISSIMIKNNSPISSSMKKKTLIILSSALRNTIEGISIGIAFSLSSIQGSLGSLAGAITLSLSMALQNFPEGLSLSIPLKNERISTIKSFLLASIPGLLEPIGGIIGVVLSNKIQPLLPLILSFAAGAIIIVVINELIPEFNSENSNKHGTIGFILGFILLLMLDIILK